MPTPTQILVVDDHQLILDGLKSTFNSIPETNVVAEASNGEQAIKIVNTLKIDLVIMDVDMPVMNGMEATIQLKKSHPGLKIIILTMHDEPSLVKRIMEIGADGFMLKNSDMEDFKKGVLEVLKGKKYFSEDILKAANNELNNSTQFNLKPSDALLLSQLTEREIEILGMIAEGLSNKEIGEKIFVSHRTVDTHRTNLMRKLDIHNIAGLIRFAIRNGLTCN